MVSFLWALGMWAGIPVTEQQLPPAPVPLASRPPTQSPGLARVQAQGQGWCGKPAIRRRARRAPRDQDVARYPLRPLARDLLGAAPLHPDRGQVSAGPDALGEPLLARHALPERPRP